MTTGLFHFRSTIFSARNMILILEHFKTRPLLVQRLLKGFPVPADLSSSMLGSLGGAAGLASESINGIIPYSRRLPAAFAAGSFNINSVVSYGGNQV